MRREKKKANSKSRHCICFITICLTPAISSRHLFSIITFSSSPPHFSAIKCISPFISKKRRNNEIGKSSSKSITNTHSLSLLYVSHSKHKHPETREKSVKSFSLPLVSSNEKQTTTKASKTWSKFERKHNLREALYKNMNWWQQERSSSSNRTFKEIEKQTTTNERSKKKNHPWNQTTTKVLTQQNNKKKQPHEKVNPVRHYNCITIITRLLYTLTTITIETQMTNSIHGL